MAFFDDIAKKFGLWGELAEQTWKTAQAKARLAQMPKVKEVNFEEPAKVELPSAGGFLSDIAKKFGLSIPAPSAPSPSAPLPEPIKPMKVVEPITGLGEPGAGIIGKMFPGVESIVRAVEEKNLEPIKEWGKEIGKLFVKPTIILPAFTDERFKSKVVELIANQKNVKPEEVNVIEFWPEMAAIKPFKLNDMTPKMAADILGVDLKATASQVKSAFRKALKEPQLFEKLKGIAKDSGRKELEILETARDVLLEKIKSPMISKVKPARLEKVSPKVGEKLTARILKTGEELTGTVKKIARMPSGAVMAELEYKPGRTKFVPISKYAEWYKPALKVEKAEKKISKVSKPEVEPVIPEELKPPISEEKGISPNPFLLQEPEKLLSLPLGVKIPKTISALKNQFSRALEKGEIEKAKKLATEFVNVLPKGRKLKLFEEGKNLAEINRPMLTVQPDNIQKAVGTIWQRLGKSGIASLEDMGEAGKELAEKFKEIEAQASIQAGEMKADMKYGAKLDKMTDDEAKSITALAEGRKPFIDNEKVRKGAEIWNKHRSFIADVAKEQNVSIRTKDGAIFQFLPRENYFPHYIRVNELLENPEYVKEVIDYQVKTGGFKTFEEGQEYAQSFIDYVKSNGKDTRFLKFYADDNRISPAEAEHILRRYIFTTSPRRFGHLERAREVNLKLYDPNPKRVLEDFYDNVWRRLYEIKEFGQNDDIAFRLISKIGQEGYDWQLAQRIFDVSTNKISFDRNLQKAFGILTDVETVKLTLSQILQITQQANIAAFTSFKNFISALRKSFTEAGKEEAMRAGVIFQKSLYEAITGIVKHGFGEKYLKKTGFTFFDNLNRITAANAAESVLKEAIKNPTKANRNLLKALLIKEERVENLIKRGTPTPDELRIAQFRLAKITQYTNRPEDLPPEWRGNQIVKSMVLFKSFAFQQTKFVKDFLLKNPKWLLRFLPVALLTTEVANDIRAFIRRKQRPSSLILRLIDDLTTLGTFGLLTDIFEASNYRGGIPKWFIGPIWGDFADIGDALSKVIHGEVKPIEKKAYEFIPYALPPEIAPYVGIGLQPLKGVLFPQQEKKGKPVKLPGVTLPVLPGFEKKLPNLPGL